VQYEEIKNERGIRMWKVDYDFSWKCIKLADGSYGGWLYLFRDATGQFELVTPALYRGLDLSKLGGDPSNL
jgi:hypothetical protein